MTADNLRTWAKALLPYGCFLMMWQYDAAFMAKAANQTAFKDIAAAAAATPRRSCKRP
jgi:hypothetical protein